MELAQVRVQWQDLVNMVMNLQFFERKGTLNMDSTVLTMCLRRLFTNKIL
jgi:hypothetical protein